MTTLEALMKGGTVEHYKYRNGVDMAGVSREIQATKDKMKKKKPVSYFRDLIPALVQRGYLTQVSKTSQHSRVRPLCAILLFPSRW